MGWKTHTISTGFHFIKIFEKGSTLVLENLSLELLDGRMLEGWSGSTKFLACYKYRLIFPVLFLKQHKKRNLTREFYLGRTRWNLTMDHDSIENLCFFSEGNGRIKDAVADITPAPGCIIRPP